MRKIACLFLLTGCSILPLAGCNTTGAEYAADSYEVHQLNTQQEAKTITIISVTPAKIHVNNKQKRKIAMTLGAIVGAITGGTIGHNNGSTAGGAISGGIAGGAAGSLVESKVLVDGVTLTYQEADKLYSSSQIGKICQFSPGTALLISTTNRETRIQPNTVCP